MIRCVCGHWHAATCHCGCTIYEPDDDTPARESEIHPPLTYPPYRGRYAKEHRCETVNP